MTFPEHFEIPLADWIDALMDWVLMSYGTFFDAVGDGILQFLLYIERFFLWLPWPLVVGAVGVTAWRLMGRWWYGVIMAGLLLLIGGFGYWRLAMMTLALVAGAVLMSLAIGIPVGIVMARNNLLESLIKPILDAMQTMPSFVYLIPALMLFGLGKVPALFATIVYAVPPVIRLTNVGIREVPQSVVEAAQAFGSSSWQILTNVQLPLARPAIMVGINQTTMMALSMVVIASMIGARGLGLEVLLAINRIEVGRGFEAGLSIVFLAIIIDRVTHAMAARQRK
ncbi:MAG: proline/glycine betaine ABC transporter permease [Desulfobacteraceae bacterium]|jgi:glycine betaine/proline transport system permease protein